MKLKLLMQDSIRLHIKEDDDYFEEFDEEGIIKI
jgi:hypothetical protein